MTNTFDPQLYEKRWLEKWNQDQLFFRYTPDPDKPKRYLLFAFAYPSGSGLHVGHVESKTALDILARYYRMKGEAVFFPVGWDAFGLPAENYAIKTGIHPSKTTTDAITTFTRQIKRLGISYAWDHEVATNDPEYYKHTQQLFLRMHESGLAYKTPGSVNWCPSCQTVLANEQAVDGVCERCGTTVVQKQLEQWYLKISKYADRLLEDLSLVDWPAATVAQQEHWIGRSTGHMVSFSIRLASSPSSFVINQEVFTTRLDTIFGATYMVVAPELVEKWMESGYVASPSVTSYLATAKTKTEEQRKIGEKTKSGAALGLEAINPITGTAVPVYVADYVLAGYGTGAVMGVPAHDERDFEFALTHQLPIKRVISTNPEPTLCVLRGQLDQARLSEYQVTQLPGHEGCYRIVGDSSGFEVLSGIAANTSTKVSMVLVDSDIHFAFMTTSGKPQIQLLTEQSAPEIITLLGLENGGNPYYEILALLWKVAGLRPSLCPAGLGVLVESGTYSGLHSLEASKKIERDFDDKVVPHTSYRLRDWLISRQRYWGVPIPIVYDPEGNPHPVKPQHLPWLLPTDVDFKPTGESPLKSSKEFVERTERLYGKGWKPEFDTMDTFVDSSWYFLRYTDPRNPDIYASADAVANLMPVDLYLIGPEHIVLHLLYSRYFTKFLYDQGDLGFVEPFAKMRHQGMILGPDHRKMSKSKGNVIDPDEIVSQYGADTLRVYEMFMGPLEADKPWNPRSVVGVYRFLKRIHQLSSRPPSTHTEPSLYQALHQCLSQVSKDIPEYKFNTAIARMMELVNTWEDYQGTDTGYSAQDMAVIVKMLAPFAPFLAEELYALGKLGPLTTVHLESWPEVDNSVLEQAQVEVVVQFLGKVKLRIEVDQQIAKDSEALKSFVMSQSEVVSLVDGREISKLIVIPLGKSKTALVNIVPSS